MNRPQSLSDLLDDNRHVSTEARSKPARAFPFYWSDVAMAAAALVIMIVASLQFAPAGATYVSQPVVLKWMQDEAE